MLPLLPAYLFLVTVALSVACLLTLYAPDVSIWVPALTAYGKATVRTNKPILKAIEVPKRWFRHFYILASLNVAFWIVFPFWTHLQWLKYLTPAVGHISMTTTVLLLILMLIHVSRRCYETQRICIYSDSKMNIGHYIMGLVHYSILPLTVICETEAYMTGKVVHSEISPSQWLGVSLFFFCNYNQHMVVRQMAAARHNPRGKSSTGHGIFYGGWFELVSSPHFFFEIGIYVSFWLLIPQSVVYLFMLLFVVVNQTFAGLLNHRWYLDNFKEYPRQRRAIFPYLL